MTENNSTQSNPDFSYIANSLNAVHDGRYRDGVTILRDGLEQQARSDDPIDVKELVKHINSALSYLEFRLENASLERQMTGDNETERRCSFCAKKQNEVARLMAGPGVFICDSCVNAYSKILQSTPV